MSIVWMQPLRKMRQAYQERRLRWVRQKIGRLQLQIEKMGQRVFNRQGDQYNGKDKNRQSKI